MPADVEQLLVDTSAAVPFVVAGHPDHAAVFERLGSSVLGLSGHAAFETYSVLSRLPAPTRRTAPTIGRLLSSNFPLTSFLGADATAALHARLSTLGITGGGVYDALVGAAAAEHGMPLASRDRRAAGTYERLAVEIIWLD